MATSRTRMERKRGSHALLKRLPAMCGTTCDVLSENLMATDWPCGDTHWPCSTVALGSPGMGEGNNPWELAPPGLFIHHAVRLVVVRVKASHPGWPVWGERLRGFLAPF